MVTLENMNGIWLLPVVALLIASIGEYLHHRRIVRVAYLAFGPEKKARAWTVVVPIFRVLAIVGLVWAGLVVWKYDGRGQAGDKKKPVTNRMMVLLDVSPSMDLQDAGEGGVQTRSARASVLLKSVLDRVNRETTKVSLASFYTDAMMLAKDCSDYDVILNFADRMPLHIAYKPGKTSLMKSLNTIGDELRGYQRKSVTLLVLTDGDTVPDMGLKPLPPSVADVIFVGVGSTNKGIFLDGHHSRQDANGLAKASRRLGGMYVDGNTKQIPTALLNRLVETDHGQTGVLMDLRWIALWVIAVSAFLLCILPLMLEYWGSSWKQVSVKPSRKEDVR